MCFESDIPKHKKKTKSSTSKSKSKSKHKHKYIECLLIDEHPHHGTYCKICGKIGNWSFHETEPLEDNPHVYRALTDEEIYEKYKHLERIPVNDLWQKYVPITNEE